MIKAPHFIKGYSLKKGGNDEHKLLRGPIGWFRNALGYVIDFSLQLMPCLKAFLIPAETCIFMWLGYKLPQSIRNIRNEINHCQWSLWLR
jgi:hypothetical protein